MYVEILAHENDKYFREASFDSEYQERLSALHTLLPVIDEVAQYYIQNSEQSKAANAWLTKLELLYYTNDSLITRMREKHGDALPENVTAEVSRLATHIYEHGGEIQRLKAALYQAYFLAFTGNFSAAHKLMQFVPYNAIIKDEVNL